jgi:ABC-type glycerol-3-phosphate transport system permease component
MRRRRESVATLALLACGLAFAIPFILIVASSFRSSTAIRESPWNLFGGGWSLDNYEFVIHDSPILRYYTNSVLVTTLIVVAQVITGVAAAFAFGYLRPVGTVLLYVLVVATISVPIQAIAVTNYLTIADFNLLNTRSGLIIPFLASAFGVYLLTEYVRSVPKTQTDAASLLGLGIAARFRFIVFPHMIPGVLAFAAFAFVGWWNEFFWPLIVLQDDHFPSSSSWQSFSARSPGHSRSLNIKEVTQGCRRLSCRSG